MLYKVFWWDSDRKTHCGYVQAADKDDAYNIADGLLQKDCKIVAVYTGHEHEITPQSLILNFDNRSEYKLF